MPSHFFRLDALGQKGYERHDTDTPWGQRWIQDAILGIIVVVVLRHHHHHGFGRRRRHNRTTSSSCGLGCHDIVVVVVAVLGNLSSHMVMLISKIRSKSETESGRVVDTKACFGLVGDGVCKPRI
jgi:hypothetical protein